MQCEICGERIDNNSKFCRKCGEKIKYSRKEQEKKVIQYLQEINENVSSQFAKNEFKKIEIRNSSLENIEFENLLEIKEDKIVFNCTKEQSVKIICAFIINEIDSFHTESRGIYKQLHNDREAKIETGWQIYIRALKTKDKVQRRKELSDATSKIIEGLNEIKKEMKDSLELFQKIPKSRIKKLFCGISLSEAQEKLESIQSSYRYYILGIKLLMVIDMENCETEKILKTIEIENMYLNEFCQHKGYGRLLEIDDENKKQWENELRDIKIKMKVIGEKLERDVISIELGGNYYE